MIGTRGLQPDCDICQKALSHAAIKWAISLRFWASRSIADHHRSSHVSPLKSQQCGQSATHNGMFSYSPAMLIAAMVIRNIKLRIFIHISHGSLLNPHYNAANRFKFG